AGGTPAHRTCHLGFPRLDEPPAATPRDRATHRRCRARGRQGGGVISIALKTGNIPTKRTGHHEQEVGTRLKTQSRSRTRWGAVHDRYGWLVQDRVTEDRLLRRRKRVAFVQHVPAGADLRGYPGCGRIDVGRRVEERAVIL